MEGQTATWLYSVIQEGCYNKLLGSYCTFNLKISRELHSECSQDLVSHMCVQNILHFTAVTDKPLKTAG